MKEEIEVIETVELETVAPEEDELIEKSPKPKKQSKPKREKKIEEDVLVDVLFTKKSAIDGKLYRVHDTATVRQSKLDKLPAKSYLVRKVK